MLRERVSSTRQVGGRKQTCMLRKKISDRNDRTETIVWRSTDRRRLAVYRQKASDTATKNTASSMRLETHGRGGGCRRRDKTTEI